MCVLYSARLILLHGPSHLTTVGILKIYASCTAILCTAHTLRIKWEPWHAGGTWRRQEKRVNEINLWEGAGVWGHGEHFTQGKKGEKERRKGCKVEKCQCLEEANTQWMTLSPDQLLHTQTLLSSGYRFIKIGRARCRDLVGRSFSSVTEKNTHTHTPHLISHTQTCMFHISSCQLHIPWWSNMEHSLTLCVQVWACVCESERAADCESVISHFTTQHSPTSKLNKNAPHTRILQKKFIFHFPTHQFLSLLDYLHGLAQALTSRKPLNQAGRPPGTHFHISLSFCPRTWLLIGVFLYSSKNEWKWTHEDRTGQDAKAFKWTS